MPRIKRKDTEVPAALRSQDVKGILRRRGVFLRQRRNQELKEAARPMAEELVKVAKKSTSKKSKDKDVIEVTPPQKYLSFADDVVEAYKLKQVGNAETLEKHFEQAINKYLTNTLLPKAIEQIPDEVAAATKAKKSKKKAQTKRMEFDDETRAFLINQAKIQLEPYLQNMAVIAGQDANKLLGIDDPYLPSEALRSRIDANVAKFTESMVDTDQQHLSDLITAGIDDGNGIPEITSTLRADFKDYSQNQASRITRTEVMRSANQSATDAFKQSGVVEGKQWVIAGAEDECAELDGEVVTLSGDFYGAQNEFQDGDPPLHPNCKCVVIPVLEKADESS